MARKPANKAKDSKPASEPKNLQPTREAAELNTSTSYSRARYAHPFYLPAPPKARQPSNGDSRMTDWSKKQLGPIPAITGNGLINLPDIIGTDGVGEIEQLGEIRFHVLGDSGVNHAEEAEKVAEDMATDYKPGAGSLNPAFLFHLGDVIYGPNKRNITGSVFIDPIVTTQEKSWLSLVITMAKRNRRQISRR